MLRKKNTGTQKSLSGSLVGGEYNLWKASVGGHYKTDRTAIAGGFLSNNADGQRLRGTKGFLNLHTASLSFNHYLTNAWQIGGRSAWDSRRFGAQNYYTTSPADSAVEKIETFWSQVQLVYQKEKNKVSLHGGFKNITDNFRFNPSSLPNNNKSKLVQAVTMYEHQFLKTTALTTGFQFQNRSIRSNDRGNHNVKQAAAFAVLQHAIGNSFHMAPALRLDWDERSGTQLIPQINLSYTMAPIVLRGSAGKTIRQADFTERYNNYNRGLVPSLNRVGNPDLKAETALNYEAGADYVWSKNFKLAATYFQRNYSDLIDFAATPYSQMPRKGNLSPTGTYFLAENIASVTTRGFETDMVFSKSFANGRQLFATWGLLFLKSETGDATPSLYISSHATFLTNLTTSYSTPRWSISTTGLYKERNQQKADAIKAQVSKAYFVLNAKAEAFIYKKKLALVLQADNIFDRTYSDLLGAQMPQRWLMAGARFVL